MKNQEVITLAIESALSDSFSIKAFEQLDTVINQHYRISFNQFILVKKGRGKINIDHIDYKINANSLLLIGKNQVYSWVDNQALSGYSLCFGDCFWDKTPLSANNCKAALFNDASANQHLLLKKQDAAALYPLFRETLNEYDSLNYINKGDVLAAFLKILMIKIANINSLLIKLNGQGDQFLYQSFLTHLESHYELSHDVSYFAEKLHISNRSLTELCQKYAGKGAKDMIKLQLITAAKRSLQFTSSPIKEIALNLNFSPYQFSHFFKKNTSVAPEAYRKQFTEIDI